MTTSPVRVLVAEDDRVARDLLCEILRGEGYEVEAVDDGAGAIERAQAGDGRYDLVVSDVRMERSGGSTSWRPSPRRRRRRRSS